MTALVVVGATGGVGRQLLDHALNAGHEVTAVVRRPEALADLVGSERGRRLQVVGLDLAAADLSPLRGAVRGANAVLSAVGASSRRTAGIATLATEALLQAMNAEDVRRIVVISAAPVSRLGRPGQLRPFDPGEDRLTRHLLGPLLRRVFAEVYADLATMEDLLRATDRDWTVIRPPRLTDGPAQPYRTAVDRSLPHGRSISRIDVAAEMLGLLDRPDSIGHTVGIAY